MLTLSKHYMIKSLPLQEAAFTVRQWNRRDLDELAKWPGYPFPYEAFNVSFREKTSEERDRLFHVREDNADMIVLTVDHASRVVMGYISLQQIDWVSREVGNFGFRIEPSWCNKGVGTLVLRKVSQWCFDCGLRTLRIDVAASNTRAVCCYEKTGFVKTGEFWRNGEGLSNIDIGQPRYDFLRPHVRLDGEVPRLRFWWMELEKGNGSDS